ncbi:hypothetical protein ACFSHT_22140 [Paraburkholderia silviterrae]|uniref:Uncharacterized protein n=1 Tax=Paraburkholderia silviterrae TaxID=2528715 RepID=A0A4R5MF76_9BURK|nr:hypothetical protein [Paraburkholderia silviterrae]TDG25911.1 hypothetical protein EYW47_00640 [Paraburkholderia silviterrae]
MTTHNGMFWRLRELVDALPDVDFEIWTSNSWRRVYFERGCPAIEPCVQRTDNHPDLMFAPGVAAYLEAVGPKRVRMLLDLIDQQARDLAAMMEDNAAQAKLAREACITAAQCTSLLRDVAALKRYNANKARPHLVNNYHVLSAPRDLLDRIDAVLAQKE